MLVKRRRQPDFVKLDTGKHRITDFRYPQNIGPTQWFHFLGRFNHLNDKLIRPFAVLRCR